MMVRQSGGGQRADTLVRPYQCHTDMISGKGDWQLSRRARTALEFSMAIASALVSSYLILRLGL